MDYRKITAIISTLKLEAVEEKLKHCCVPEISVIKVMGYGESPNLFRSDWTHDAIHIEMYLGAEKARQLAQIIMETASTGGEDDGIVAISPVESLYRIRTGQLVNDH